MYVHVLKFISMATLTAFVSTSVDAKYHFDNKHHWHRPNITVLPDHQTNNPWYQQGAKAIFEKSYYGGRKAKNVILFVGDGMGMSTVTAARILEGQLNGQSGEENNLSFDLFPYTGLAKTYNVDAQTPVQVRRDTRKNRQKSIIRNRPSVLFATS